MPAPSRLRGVLRDAAYKQRRVFRAATESDATGGVEPILGATAVAFTDGDTVRRVTVTDASITATDKILVSVRRPDLADDSADSGHIYIANVVLVASGSFDVVIACYDRGFDDATETPPNETIQLIWSRAT